MVFGKIGDQKDNRNILLPKRKGIVDFPKTGKFGIHFLAWGVWFPVGRAY